MPRVTHRKSVSRWASLGRRGHGWPGWPRAPWALPPWWLRQSGVRLCVTFPSPDTESGKEWDWAEMPRSLTLTQACMRGGWGRRATCHSASAPLPARCPASWAGGPAWPLPLWDSAQRCWTETFEFLTTEQRLPRVPGRGASAGEQGRGPGLSGCRKSACWAALAQEVQADPTRHCAPFLLRRV